MTGRVESMISVPIRQRLTLVSQWWLGLPLMLYLIDSSVYAHCWAEDMVGREKRQLIFLYTSYFY